MLISLSWMELYRYTAEGTKLNIKLSEQPTAAESEKLKVACHSVHLCMARLRTVTIDLCLAFPTVFLPNGCTMSIIFLVKRVLY